MKLVYRILLHLSWALSLLLAAWAVLFYFTLIDEINDEVDDSLENYAEVLVKRNLAGRELPAAFSGSNNGYFLHDVSAEYAAARPHMVYSDEEIFIPEKDEEEPARVLRMALGEDASALMDAFGIEELAPGELDLTPGCIDRARAARGEGPLAG